ncbi:MAG: BrnA antitoxin family protein [Candidatus Omnitrophota bacterium]|nr:BrnA antitoxin family protein [Candidatus Omnitrophota bacterium]
MKKHRIEEDMPIGGLKRIDDLLPPPEELAVPEETVMVTLRLSEKSVDFFKRQAKRYHTKYQKMLRFLVDKYAERYS